jgi:VCBS repeat-containing protein
LAAGVTGVVSVRYGVSDGRATIPAEATWTVTGVNDAPSANPDRLAASEDATATYTAAQLLGNDTDVDGDRLVIASVTSGVGGTAVLNGDGSVTFTPTRDFNGRAAFTYTVSDRASTSAPATVTVDVAGVNDRPIADADTLEATEDTAVIFAAAQLLGNDTDVDGDTLVIASVTSGVGGTAVLNADGSVTFTPAGDFNGRADFTYTVSDGALTSAPTTVAVNVRAVNDAPRLGGTGGTLSYTENDAARPIAPSLTVDDPDERASSVRPFASRATVAGEDELGFFDTDTDGIEYAFDQAAGTLTLTGQATLAEYRAALRSVTYRNTSENPSTATRTATFTVDDGSVENRTSNPVAVTISITATDDQPTAVDDTATVAEDAAATEIPVLANDTDPDDGTKQITAVTQAAHGAVLITSGGTGLTYRPNANYSGADSFTYTLNGGSTATVNVTVTGVNDPPTAQNSSASTDEDVALTGSVSANAADVDGDSLTYELVSGPTRGSITFAADGAYTYTPFANANGPDSFTWRASDGTLASNDATVAITVSPVNDAPVISGASRGTVREDVTFQATGSLQVTDPDAGATRTLTTFRGTAQGTSARPADFEARLDRLVITGSPNNASGAPLLYDDGFDDRTAEFIAPGFLDVAPANRYNFNLALADGRAILNDEQATISDGGRNAGPVRLTQLEAPDQHRREYERPEAGWGFHRHRRVRSRATRRPPVVLRRPAHRSESEHQQARR